MNRTLQDRWQAHLRLAEEFRKQELKAQLYWCDCAFRILPETSQKTAA